MKSRLLLPAFALLLSFAAASPAADNLVLNGTGIRTKTFLGAMYELSLYLPAEMKGAHPKAVIEDSRPMSLELAIRSSLITRERFVEATTEGFAKSAQSGYVSNDTKSFLDQFANIEFSKGDSISMTFENGGLVTVYRKPESKTAKAVETKLGRIPGLELKRALFAIWLGDSPVQDSLKKALLGEK